MQNNLDSSGEVKFFKIYITSILEYFQGTVRPFREGQNIVGAGWVYRLGTLNDKIVGYVIQTSKMKSIPHEIQLLNVEFEASKWECTCSCKAGAGEKCKLYEEELVNDELNDTLLREQLEGAPISELNQTKVCYRSKIIPVTFSNSDYEEEFFKMVIDRNSYVEKFIPVMNEHLKVNKTIEYKYITKIKKNCG